MGDTATTVANNPDGTITKTIHTEAAVEDLVDALTNFMHVEASKLEVEDPPAALRFWDLHGPLGVEQAWSTARGHFEAEQRGDDGVKVVVE